MAAPAQSKSPIFHPGELIPRDGIYTIIHNVHPCVHTSILPAGLCFPSCPRCGDEVSYEFTLVIILQDEPQAKSDVPATWH